MERYIVSELDSNQRIDKYLRKVMKANALNAIFKAFRKKDIKVNGKWVLPSYLLHSSDEISVYLDKKVTVEKPIDLIEKRFKVVYEDASILVVSKPIGVSVQEDDSSNGHSLSNQVLAYLFGKKEYDPATDVTYTPSPVHRIDRNTTGLVIFAKNFIASQEFSKMFKLRTNISKYYLALVHGLVEESGTITLPIYKDTTTNRVTIHARGDNATTLFKRIRFNDEFSLVEVQIITGRTHQIRVHFASIGHPLIGDNKYGDYEVNSNFYKKFKYKYQFLHAYKIKIADISGRFSYLNDKEFIDELPEDKMRITTQIFGK